MWRKTRLFALSVAPFVLYPVFHLTLNVRRVVSVLLALLSAFYITVGTQNGYVGGATCYKGAYVGV